MTNVDRILSTKQLYEEAIRLIKEHGTHAEAAAFAQKAGTTERGIRRSTFSKRLSAAVRDQDGAAVPLSEDERKFHEEWTAEDCVAHLRDLASQHPDAFLSRNWFRVNSDISEATWNRYFGTFLEFKRQARLQLSRHAHRLELNVARHASVDPQRDMNVEKSGWEGAFARDRSTRFQSVLVATDQHDLNCDPFYRRVLVDTARRLQPEKIVFPGDLFDLPEFSKHTKDPRSFELLARVNWVHEFLKDMREAAPEAEMTLVEGNHEFRLLRHLAEESPAMMVVLADLHGFTVSKLLGLEKFDVNFVARADLTAWNEVSIKAQLRKNYLIQHRCLLFGHYPDMRNMGYPGASGHHHRHLLWSSYSPTFGPMEWHQVGCGHRREASYMAGETFANGFLICHVDTLSLRTQFEYVDVSHTRACVGGKFYERAGDEPVLDLSL